MKFLLRCGSAELPDSLAFYRRMRVIAVMTDPRMGMVSE